MKHLLLVFIMSFLLANVIQAQHTASKIKQFEAEIYAKAEDAKALDLIELNSEAKLAFTKYKAMQMAEYDVEMNEFEKSQKFNKESADSDEVKAMIAEIELTTQAKQDYLKSQYPVYLQLFNQTKRKKAPRRLQNNVNQRVQTQPIRGGN